MNRMFPATQLSVRPDAPPVHFTKSGKRQPAFALAALAIAHLAQCYAAAGDKPTFAAAPVYFEQNIGQHDAGLYRATGSRFSVAFEETGARISTRRGKPVSMAFVGAQKTRPVGETRSALRLDYFRGREKRDWHLNVPVFQQIRYGDLYPGIDSVFYGRGRALEYDFVVSPGADPNAIRFRMDGADRVEVATSGALVASVGDGVVHHHARPIAYQVSGGRRRAVDVRFVRDRTGEIRFQVGRYDRARTLVIDPVLSFSEYIGGSMDDQGVDVATDPSGNIYVLGTVRYSSNAPGTAGWDDDAFLYKYSPDGVSLLYGAIIGGTYTEEARGLAVDGSGKAYITGGTSSSDFPVSSNAYSTTARKVPDAFVCVLDTTRPLESSLVYSTHFPADRGNAIALDVSGNIYITGIASWNFATTPGAFQTTCPGCSWYGDAFVAKFDIHKTGLASLIYSTYLGGSTVPTMGTGKDEGLAIVVDSTGEAIVTGQASSTNFPVKLAFDATYNGGIGDVFVAKLNATGSGLVFSTLLGTDGFDSGQGVALDPSGNIYVTGITNWYNFPTTAGAWQSAWNANQCGSVSNDPCPDAFVTKLSVTGAMVYSTYLGGILPDYGYDIAVDSAGNAYVAGYTISANFPLVNQLPGVSKGANDAFVTKLNASGTGLAFSTLIGGSSKDEGKAIALSGSNVLLVGTTIATDFPIVNPYLSTNSGGTDAFVVKFPVPGSAPILSALTVAPSSVAGGAATTGTVTLTAAAPAAGTVVTLASSNTAVATVPASVTVAAGATSAKFTVATKAVATSTALTISASMAGIAKTAALTVTPAPAALSTLAISPTTVVGTVSATGTVTLTKAAPAGGAVVALTSNNTAAATVPASVTVGAGALSATFAISSKAVAATAAVAISAVYGGLTKTAVLSVTPILSAVSVSPLSVVGGLNATGTVSLGIVAPAGGATVTLASSNTSAATTPASVVIPAGTKSASFAVATKVVTTSPSVTISASFGGATKTAVLIVTPMLKSVAVSPASVVGGTNSTGTVTLGAAAPAGGAVVALVSSNTAVAVAPPSVTVPAGATTATFAVATKAVLASTAATISASRAGTTKTATLTITPVPLAVSALTVSPSTLVGGANATGTVTLTKAAGTGGAVVALASSNTAAATTPLSVTVPAGATTATFTVATKAVTVSTAVTLSGTFGGVTKTAVLTVSPLLKSLTLSPTSVVGGATSTGTIALAAAAPAGGVVVTLASSNTAAATTPLSVTVPAGATTATFTVGTKAVTVPTTVTLSGAFGGVTKTAVLTVSPRLKSLTLSPTSVKGGAISSGTVTLASAAPAGGVVVTLASSNTAAATTPLSVTVPAGATTAAFTVTTKTVAASTPVVISATHAGATAKATLTVTP